MKSGGGLYLGLLAAAGLGLAIAFRPKADEGPVAAGTGERTWTPSDVEWLARMFTMEVGDIDPGPEWAGVGYVARNRALRNGKGLREVVYSPSWIGTGPDGRDYLSIMGQNEGRSARGRLAPPTHARWQKALGFAKQVLLGAVENPIGTRRSYVHPRSLEPASGPAPKGVMVREGKLWPVWAVAKAEGGKAEQAPLEVGRAVFV